MDTTVRLSPLKFSLQATIDHHGPSIDSGHYTASINCCKKHSIATITKLRSLELLIKTPLLHILYHINGLTHDFWTRTEGWEFDRSHGAGTSSPSHWQQVEEQAPKPVGWTDDVFPRDELGSRPEVSVKSSVNIYIYMYIPYTSSVIGRIYNRSVIQYWRSCIPSRSIGECAVPGLNATFCFLWFTNCVLLFDKNLILGCLWLLVFVLNILILGIWCSTIPHLPGCFVPGPSLRISDSTRC